jgi:hypothetical protein
MYKPLTGDKLKEVYNLLKAKFDNGQSPKALLPWIELVKQYYPNTAVQALLRFNSEYNDSGYDYSPGFLIVYDIKGKELIPIEGKSKEARIKLMNLGVPNLPGFNGEYVGDDDPTPEFILNLNSEATMDIPILYVRE